MCVIILILLWFCFLYMSFINVSKFVVLFCNLLKLIIFEVIFLFCYWCEGLRWCLMGLVFYGNCVIRIGVYIKGFLIWLFYWKFSEFWFKLKFVWVWVWLGWSFVCVLLVCFFFKGIEEIIGNWMCSVV